MIRKNTIAKPTEILIASLDILGITQMMIDAKPDKLRSMASTIKNAFDAAKQSVVSFCTHDDRYRQPFQDIFDTAIRFHDFSDTLVISCDVNSITKVEAEFAIVFFMLQVRFSVYELFVAGFPVRGCIDCGFVAQTENLIVGSPYAKAHFIGESLDFSGVVVTDAAKEFYEKHKDRNVKNAPIHIIDLFVPVKNGGFVKYNCLDWILESKSHSLRKVFAESNNWTQLLYDKFSDNGKQMTESALRKVANTANTLLAFHKLSRHVF